MMKSNLGKLFADLQARLHTLPPKVGAETVRHARDQFATESFEGDLWEPRKEVDAGRNLLVDSGRLRRSIRYEIRGLRITVGTDVPYAEAHNEGMDEDVTVPAHTRRRGRTSARVRAYRRRQRLPKRQFLGITEPLRERLVALIVRTLFK